MYHTTLLVYPNGSVGKRYPPSLGQPSAVRWIPSGLPRPPHASSGCQVFGEIFFSQEEISGWLIVFRGKDNTALEFSYSGKSLLLKSCHLRRWKSQSPWRYYFCTGSHDISVWDSIKLSSFMGKLSSGDQIQLYIPVIVQYSWLLQYAGYLLIALPLNYTSCSDYSQTNPFFSEYKSN